MNKKDKKEMRELIKEEVMRLVHNAGGYLGGLLLVLAGAVSMGAATSGEMNLDTFQDCAVFLCGVVALLMGMIMALRGIGVFEK